MVTSEPEIPNVPADARVSIPSEVRLTPLPAMIPIPVSAWTLSPPPELICIVSPEMTFRTDGAEIIVLSMVSAFALCRV